FLSSRSQYWTYIFRRICMLSVTPELLSIFVAFFSANAGNLTAPANQEPGFQAAPVQRLTTAPSQVAPDRTPADATEGRWCPECHANQDIAGAQDLRSNQCEIEKKLFDCDKYFKDNKIPDSWGRKCDAGTIEDSVDTLEAVFYSC